MVILLLAALVPVVRCYTSLFYERLAFLHGRKLELEDEKSQIMIANMMPKSVAETLRDGLSWRPEQIDQVTVIFTDLVGFTKTSSSMEPPEVLLLLNEVFSEFDHITEKYNVYKVETIGDAYFAVCGLEEHADGAVEAAGFCLEIMEAIGRHSGPTGEPLRMRVGMHTGQVVAGVVGMKMPRYHLFGDTVHIAESMESSGEAGRIQMTSDTAACLQRALIIDGDR